MAFGCTRRGAERVVVQVADEVYGAGRVAGVGTAGYPRADIGGETRIVCSPPQRDTLEGTLFARDLAIPLGATVHFAFALDAGESFTALVDVNAAVKTERGTEVVYRTTLDGSANDYGRWQEAVVRVPAAASRLEIYAATSAFGAPAGATEKPPSLHVSCPVVTAPARDALPPNVVLVSLDTLRADRLGLYGYARDTSPRMDRIFGKEGFVFERAIAPASNTLRSHAGMLTGLQPIVAVANWSDAKLGRLGRYPTLADWLRANGYRTAAFTEDGFLSDVTFGFGQGFELFNERKGVSGNVHNPGSIDVTFRRGIDWVAAHRREPFFLFLHSYEVHSPYRPAREFRERFPSAGGADQARIDSDLYDGEVAQADRAIGNLVDELRRLGVLERTLLVVTSDHGEEFGEHGGRYHGAHLYDEVLHVPWLVRAPGLAAAGKRYGGAVSLVDVTPTILDLVGIEPADFMTGRSRAGELRGDVRAGGRDGTEPLFSEGVTWESMTYRGPDPDWRSPALAVTSWPHRLIRYARDDGARYELYDVNADPKEKTDLFARDSARPEIAALRTALDEYEATWNAKAQEMAAKLNVAPMPATPAAPSERQREELRALGYVD